MSDDRWTTELCRGQVNDGSRVETRKGRLTTVGRLRTGVGECERLRRSDDEVDRALRSEPCSN